MVGRTAPRAVHPVLRPYLKNSIYVNPEKQMLGELLGTSLETSAGDRTSHQSREAKVALGEWRNKNATGICTDQDIKAHWGGGGARFSKRMNIRARK